MYKICRDIVKEYLPIWNFWTGYTNIICSKNSNIPYNLIFKTKFNDSSILITIISCKDVWILGFFQRVNVVLPDHIKELSKFRSGTKWEYKEKTVLRNIQMYSQSQRYGLYYFIWAYYRYW